jgi:hypothetical protein
MSLDRAESRTPLLKYFAICVTLIPAFVILFATPGWWIQNLLTGDATAYSIVAFNIASGAGSTYDGLTSTNGYHPLWLAMHIPLMSGAEAPIDRLFLSKALVVLTTLAAAFAWMKVAETYLQNKVSSWLMLAWVGGSGWSIFVLYAGLETPLVLLMVGLCLLSAKIFFDETQATSPGISTWYSARLGLVMGLCFLSRLDTIFFLILLSLMLLPTLIRSGVGNAIAWALSGLSVVVPYLLFNLIKFGAIMPVSGVVKNNADVDVTRSFQTLYSSVERIGKLMPSFMESIFPIVASSLAIAGIFIIVWIYYLIPRYGRVNPLVLIPLGAILQFLYYFLFMRELLIAWHIYMQVLAIFILIAALPITQPFSNSMQRQKVVTSLLLVVLIATSCTYAYMKSFRRSDRESSYAAAHWIEELPQGSRLAMYDSWYVQLLAGPGYHVLDLSGLVTDRETALKAKERDYDALLEDHSIEYVLGWEGGVRNLKDINIEERIEVPWNHRQRVFVLGRRE